MIEGFEEPGAGGAVVAFGTEDLWDGLLVVGSGLCGYVWRKGREGRGGDEHRSRGLSGRLVGSRRVIRRCREPCRSHPRILDLRG